MILLTNVYIDTHIDNEMSALLLHHEDVTVDISADGVSIYTDMNPNQELVSWIQDEITEAPDEVMPALINAIALALTNPARLREILGKG